MEAVLAGAKCSLPMPGADAPERRVSREASWKATRTAWVKEEDDVLADYGEPRDWTQRALSWDAKKVRASLCLPARESPERTAQPDRKKATWGANRLIMRKFHSSSR